MYDLIVLGAGPGGYEAAALAGAKGLSVCIIEKKHIGGTCLNEGCLPLKYFLHASKSFKEINALRASGVFEKGMDIAAVQKNIVSNKDMIVEGLRQSVKAKLDYNKVETVEGFGKIKSLSAEKVEIDVEGTLIEGKQLIIATGSSERKISFEGTPHIPVIYSSEFLELKEIPKQIAVVGAGVIGLEAASYFSDLGAKVTLIDIMTKVGGAIDSEVEKSYERILKKNGINLCLGNGLRSINGNKIVLDDGNSIEADLCLVAVGRVANTSNIGLEEAGIEFDKKGIIIDEKCRTNIANVYAIGDCTGKLMLAHTAYHQAAVVVDNLSGKDSEVRYDLIPQVIYSNPEITTVGMTEDACKENGVSYVAKSIPMTYSGKYFAEHGKDGALIKFTADENGKFLGASIVGNGCSEIGIFFEQMLKSGANISDFKELIYPHPTMGEVIKELAELF